MTPAQRFEAYHSQRFPNTVGTLNAGENLRALLQDYWLAGYAQGQAGLREYGQHKKDCALVFAPGCDANCMQSHKCTCGLHALLPAEAGGGTDAS